MGRQGEFARATRLRSILFIVTNRGSKAKYRRRRHFGRHIDRRIRGHHVPYLRTGHRRRMTGLTRNEMDRGAFSINLCRHNGANRRRHGHPSGARRVRGFQHRRRRTINANSRMSAHNCRHYNISRHKSEHQTHRHIDGPYLRQRLHEFASHATRRRRHHPRRRIVTIDGIH